MKIVLRALEEPVRQIANNAGLEGSIVVDRLKREEVGIGFNAADGEWVNMMQAGIVDPTKGYTFSTSKRSICCSYVLNY